jgi:hypothetical protein
VHQQKGVRGCSKKGQKKRKKGKKKRGEASMQRARHHLSRAPQSINPLFTLFPLHVISPLVSITPSMPQILVQAHPRNP